jgi:hypothetical protein
MAYGSVLTDVVQSSVTGSPPQFNDGAGTQIGTICRAWVNFNGVTTVAVRGSFNVSSVTRAAAGDYTVNFTTAMPDGNYSLVSTGSSNGINSPAYLYMVNASYAFSTTSVHFNTGYYSDTSSSFTKYDAVQICVSIFR